MSSFALCSPGDINILSANPGTSPSPNPIAYSAAAVIISHGKNGYGASQPNGIRVIDPPASNADETANKTGVPGASTPVVQFVSRNRTSDSTGCSDTAAGGTQCEFDDIVAWIPTTTLIARMAAAGKLP